MPPKSKSNQFTYNANNIVSLTPREHIRRRPGMYIGGTDSRALHSLFRITLDELIETSLQQEYRNIEIELCANQMIKFSVDTSGFLTEIHYDRDRGYSPCLMLLMESVYGIWNTNGKNTLVPRGLHGVYLDAVNALSASCIAEVWRDGVHWWQEYSEGLPITPLQRTPIASDKCGIRITFTPDYTIMENNDFDFHQIAARCRELSYLIPQINFTVSSHGSLYSIEETYTANHLAEWLANQNRYITRLLEPILHHDRQQVIPKHGRSHYIEVTIAFQYIETDTAQIKSYVNSVETIEGGTHVDGFYKGLLDVVNSYLEKPLKQAAVESGLLAILHIKHYDPQFESQTRIKLLNPEVEEIVYDTVKNALSQQPEMLKLIAHLIAEKSQKARYVQLQTDTDSIFKH